MVCKSHIYLCFYWQTKLIPDEVICGLRRTWHTGISVMVCRPFEGSHTHLCFALSTCVTVPRQWLSTKWFRISVSADNQYGVALIWLRSHCRQKWSKSDFFPPMWLWVFFPDSTNHRIWSFQFWLWSNIRNVSDLKWMSEPLFYRFILMICCCVVLIFWTSHKKSKDRITVFWPAAVDPLQEVLVQEAPREQDHHLPLHLHHPHSRRWPTGPPPPQTTRLPRGRSYPWAHPGRGAWWVWRHCWPHWWRCPPEGSGPHRLNAARPSPACPSPSAPPAIPEQRVTVGLLSSLTPDIYSWLLKHH